MRCGAGVKIAMRQFYERNRIFVAAALIFFCSFILAPIRGRPEEGALWSAAVLMLIAASLLALAGHLGLFEAFGLRRWPHPAKRFLYFLPLWILSLGNLLGGIRAEHTGAPLCYAAVSMLLVGLIEELLFRGFLFRAVLEEKGEYPALLVSALSFGLIHAVNLLAGQDTLTTCLQVLFAVNLGFVYALVYLRSGSLLPCILSHALINGLSLFSAGSLYGNLLQVGASLMIGGLYALFLRKLPTIS